MWQDLVDVRVLVLLRPTRGRSERRVVYVQVAGKGKGQPLSIGFACIITRHWARIGPIGRTPLGLQERGVGFNNTQQSRGYVSYHAGSTRLLNSL
jgi:hypothetical protein